MSGFITAVNRSATHEFTKPNASHIELVAGLGVRGDAHLGETVQHLVRVREDPTKPNLRQVHLIRGESLCLHCPRARDCIWEIPPSCK